MSGYSEQVVFPIVLGSASGSKVTSALTFNSPLLTNPASVQTDYPSRIAAIDFDYAQDIYVQSPKFAGS